MHTATPPAPCPPSTAHLALPFFDDAHRVLAEGLVPWAAAQQIDETDDRSACRDWVKRLGAGGWLRYCVPAEYGGALPALYSRAGAAARDSGLPLAAGGLCVCDAGAGQRCDHAGGQPRAAGALPARCGARRADCGVCAQRARGGLRCRRYANHSYQHRFHWRYRHFLLEWEADSSTKCNVTKPSWAKSA